MKSKKFLLTSGNKTQTSVEIVNLDVATSKIILTLLTEGQRKHPQIILKAIFFGRGGQKTLIFQSKVGPRT